jgi:zinc transport system ATP-binding protein
MSAAPETSPAPAPVPVPAAAENEVIQLRGVDFAYARNAPVLEGVEFRVREGEFLGLIGPNGGGKTTLLKLILGLLQPRQGTVRVLGEDPTGLAFDRRRLGYVPQETTIRPLFPATLLDLVLMGTYGTLGLFRRPGAAEDEAAREALARVGLHGLEEHSAWKLSGGQMQRVAIARALVSRPKLLLLDEPTSGLDTGGQARLFELLERLKREYGLTVVMVSHDVTALAHYAGQVACLNKRLHWHDRSELLSEAVLREVYQCELDAFFIRHREHLEEFHSREAPAGHVHGPHCDHDHEPPKG